MKKIIGMFMVMAIVFTLVGCGSGNSAADNTDNAPVSGNTEIVGTDTTAPVQVEIIDVDLTQLSSTMVYSEVYNMMYEPDGYIGKTVRMNGQFVAYTNEEETAYYPAVIIADAAACCSQGIEFVLAGEKSYPNDYPELNSDITVTGVFETYSEDGYLYCHLVDAVVGV